MPNETIRMTRKINRRKQRVGKYNGGKYNGGKYNGGKYNGGKYNGRKYNGGASMDEMISSFKSNFSGVFTSIKSIKDKLTGVNSDVGGWFSNLKSTIGDKVGGLLPSNGDKVETVADKPTPPEQAGGIKTRRSGLNKTRRRVRVRA